MSVEELKRRYEKAVARNNRLAVKDPAFARRLMAARAHAYEVVRSTPELNGRTGMGFVWTPLIAIPVTVLGGGTLLAGILGIRWLTQMEEHEFQSQNPLLSTVQTASNALWAVLLIGGIALGGLVYWDIRQGNLGKGEGRRRTTTTSTRRPPPSFAPRRTSSRRQAFVGTPTGTGVVVGDADFELFDDDVLGRETPVDDGPDLEPLQAHLTMVAMKRRWLKYGLIFGAAAVPAGIGIYYLVRWYFPVGKVDFQGRRWSFTEDDKLWMGRMLVGETGGESRSAMAAVAWSVITRWVTKPVFQDMSLTQVMRAFSQPINPKWADMGAAGCQRSPGMCSEQALARRRRITNMSWSEMPSATTSFVEAFARGHIADPTPGYNNFAAAGSISSSTLSSSELPPITIGGNTFIRDPGSLQGKVRIV
jgi:hypothetical protein